MLQSFSTLSEPGQDPPYFSVTFLALVLYIVPPPQDLAQDEKSLHGPQMQGTVKDIMIEHEVYRGQSLCAKLRRQRALKPTWVLTDPLQRPL